MSELKPTNAAVNYIESSRHSFGRVNLIYVPIEADSTRNSTRKEALELITSEMPKQDLVVMEYFPPEIGQDPIFRLQQIRFPAIAALAAKLGKQVLTVDPAFDSQFLVDFRGVPIAASATALGIATHIFQGESRNNSGGSSSYRGPTRRNLLRGAAAAVGLAAVTPIYSSIVGEKQLTDQPRTSFPCEGTVRRIIISRGIQQAADYYTNDDSREINALIVYPDWLKPALDMYMADPKSLDADFHALAAMKQIPRFKHYFQARLYTPQNKTGGETTWNKSVREII